MQIRRADQTDIPAINRLLCQVLTVHHQGRPDLFKPNAKKYTDSALCEIISDDTRPIFVATNAQNETVGYAFCVLQQHQNHEILTDVKGLYIDDLCVDEALRGQAIGKTLYEYVCAYAKEIGCYNVTLNVWACNENARRFYEKLGMQTQKIGMETIL